MSKDRTDSVLFSHFAAQFVASGMEFRFQAKGRSMWPTIRDGDVLQVRSASFEKLRAGDVVLFKSGNGLRAHRIIRRRGDFFITRGDAGVENDGQIRREEILGKVVAKECSTSRQLIPLSDGWDRAGFFLRELRRWLSRPVASQI
jgi:signal peptidase I